MHRNSCITCCCVLCIWLIRSTEVYMQSQSSLVLFWRDVYLLLNPRQPRRSVSDRVCWFVSARCEGFFSWPGEWQLCYSLKRQLFLDLCWEELVFSTVKCEWRTIERHEENHSQRGFSLISHAWHAGAREKSALGHGAETPSQVHYEKVICKSASVWWETTSTDLLVWKELKLGCSLIAMIFLCWLE